MATNHFHILIADDDTDLRAGLKILLREMFGKIAETDTPGGVIKYLDTNYPDLLLLDLNFARGRTDGGEGIDLLQQIHTRWPDLPVVILTAWAGIGLAVECMKLGAADFITKPWDNLRLEATLLAALRTGMIRREAKEALERENTLQRQSICEGLLVAESPAMKKVLELVAKVSSTDAAVIITGENGSGKNMIAREIHKKSRRVNQSFVLADLGSLSPSLFEDSLFGHEKGAFTDAMEQHLGLFELADGGTLFLDEVANLPLHLQPKLLTVLSTGMVTRLGSNSPRNVDVRIITATNSPLTSLIENGQFREDLFYRINTIELRIPPLRERVEDFAILVDHFNNFYAGKYHKKPMVITSSLLKKMQTYSWPGNVRELAHTIERAIILGEPEKPDLSLLIPSLPDNEARGKHRLDEAERESIARALRTTGGNMLAAARILGIGRTTLYRKIGKYGL